MCLRKELLRHFIHHSCTLYCTFRLFGMFPVGQHQRQAKKNELNEITYVSKGGKTEKKYFILCVIEAASFECCWREFAYGHKVNTICSDVSFSPFFSPHQTSFHFVDFLSALSLCTATFHQLNVKSSCLAHLYTYLPHTHAATDKHSAVYCVSKPTSILEKMANTIYWSKVDKLSIEFREFFDRNKNVCV